MILRVFAICLLIANVVRAGWPFPSAPGTVWQYTLTRESDPSTTTFTRKILPAEDGEDQNAISLESAVDGSLQSLEWLKLQDNAVLAISRSDDGKLTTFDSPVVMLPSKLEAGASCGGDAEIAGVPVAVPFAVVGEEEVKVPAGSFRAWRIHGEDRRGIMITADRWFVPGVGSVKESVTERSPSGALLVRNTVELTAAPLASGDSSAASPNEPKHFEASVSTSSDGDPLQTISPGALQIVARWQLHEGLKNSKVRAVWIAEDVGEVASPEYKVDEATAVVTSPEAHGTFTLERPEDGWAPGNYRVEFYVGNVLTDKIELTIGSDPSLASD